MARTTVRRSTTRRSSTRRSRLAKKPYRGKKKRERRDDGAAPGCGCAGGLRHDQGPRIGRSALALRIPRLAEPTALERNYAATIIREIVNVVSRLNRELVRPRLAEILAEAEALRPAKNMRRDRAADTTEAVFAGLRLRFLTEVPESRRLIIAREIASSLSGFNLRQVGRQLGAIGFDLVEAEPWLDDEITSFVDENVRLITDLSTKQVDTMANIVNTGVRSGRTASAMAAEIAKVNGVTKRRARFIARDQLASFQGQLTRLRQKAAGIETYTWRTSLDERVRDSHRSLEGRTFSWDRGAPINGRRLNPGEDFNCRCYAEPRVPGIESLPRERAFRRGRLVETR